MRERKGIRNMKRRLSTGVKTIDITRGKSKVSKLKKKKIMGTISKALLKTNKAVSVFPCVLA
jgi:hypothetical protein